ncbi:MAG: hypothetical protein LBT46_14320 [Planctomycetaceae bacterium]|jgi:hypothetical protein|nr:hypothetical protein [Planctomycetaceae bacterium]
MHTRIIIIFVTVFGLLVTGCSNNMPKGFPKNLKPFSVKLLHEGQPVEKAIIAMYGESSGAGFRIMGVTGTDGTAAMETSINNYAKRGSPAGTYKAVVSHTPKLPSDSEDTSKMNTGELEAYADKQKAEYAAAVKIVPAEWNGINTTPVTITVPEKGGSVTIEITDEKTFVQ